MILINIIAAIIALVIGSITDIKKREVPDYVSYILIYFCFGVSIIYSIIYWNYIYIAQTTMGFVLGLILAYAMFYLGQWGGGDSKLLMGLGAAIGFNVFGVFGEHNISFLTLLLNILLVGAVYGIVWSIYLAIKNRKIFMKKFGEYLHKKEIIIVRRILLSFTVLALIVIFFLLPVDFHLRYILFGIIAALFVMFYMWLFVKIIEESCMIKEIPVEKLTEGDWIYKDVYIGKKKIAGPKDLGISKEQIELLLKLKKKGKIRKIMIKEGIPFIPSFLIALILTLLLGNWFFLFL